MKIVFYDVNQIGFEVHFSQIGEFDTTIIHYQFPEDAAQYWTVNVYRTTFHFKSNASTGTEVPRAFALR